MKGINIISPDIYIEKLYTIIETQLQLMKRLSAALEEIVEGMKKQERFLPEEIALVERLLNVLNEYLRRSYDA